MSGSRFHPYTMEERTKSNSDMSRKTYHRPASSTETTSHQATSSQKVFSHSTTVKTNRLPNGNPKSFPSNKAVTASASRQVAFTPLTVSPVVSTPLSWSKAASALVASKPAKSSAVASQPATSIPVASQPATSSPVVSQPATSTPEGSQPATSTAVASQPGTSAPVALHLTASAAVASKPATSIPLVLRRGTSTRQVSSTPLAPLQAASTFLPAESVRSGLAAYPYWSMAQNLYAMEQQQKIQLQQQWRQQMWMQQPNMMSMASASQEYLRYMNELRHMSVLPLIPTSPSQLSYLSPMQDQPLNLSLKNSVKHCTPSSLSSSYSPNKPIGSIDCFTPESPKCSKQPSPKSSSPPLLKLHPTKPIQVGSLDPQVEKMFPHLRTTDMGSIVLWNFLWALLADKNYKGIISWVNRPSLKFEVVHPLALAKLWGTVKKNKTMNWQKLLKVINLYLSKNILKQGEDKLLFQFILVPQSPEVKAERDS